MGPHSSRKSSAGRDMLDPRRNPDLVLDLVSLSLSLSVTLSLPPSLHQNLRISRRDLLILMILLSRKICPSALLKSRVGVNTHSQAATPALQLVTLPHRRWHRPRRLHSALRTSSTWWTCHLGVKVEVVATGCNHYLGYKHGNLTPITGIEVSISMLVSGERLYNIMIT